MKKYYFIPHAHRGQKIYYFSSLEELLNIDRLKELQNYERFSVAGNMLMMETSHSFYVIGYTDANLLEMGLPQWIDPQLV